MTDPLEHAKQETANTLRTMLTELAQMRQAISDAETKAAEVEGAIMANVPAYNDMLQLRKRAGELKKTEAEAAKLAREAAKLARVAGVELPFGFILKNETKPTVEIDMAAAMSWARTNSPIWIIETLDTAAAMEWAKTHQAQAEAWAKITQPGEQVQIKSDLTSYLKTEVITEWIDPLATTPIIDNREQAAE